MSEILLQPPTRTVSEDVEKKIVSGAGDGKTGCVLYITDLQADGVAIDVDNKESKDMHIRLDFGESENLILHVAPGIMKVDDVRCAFDCPIGTFKRIIHLEVENLDVGSYELKYKLHGFFRNAKGELVDASGKEVAKDAVSAGGSSGASAGGSSGAGAGGAAPGASSSASVPAGGTASGSASKSGTGGASSSSASTAAAPAAAPAAAAAAAPQESPFGESEAEIEFKKVNDHIQLKLLHFEGFGYEFRVVSNDKCPATILQLDASASENLSVGVTRPAEDTGVGKLQVRVPAGAGEFTICRLTMKDENDEGYGMSYKVSARVDSSASSGSASGEIKPGGSKKAEEEASAKKKADEEAAIAGEIAKKKKAEEDAAKKKADEEAAAKRAGEAKIAGELARKKAAEKAAEEKPVAGEMMKKKKEEEAAKDKARQEMMEKARAGAEAAQKAEEEKARKKKEYEDERKKVADDHAAKEKVLYGEFDTKKMTPFEEKEVANADKEAAKEAEDFIKDCVGKNAAMAALKPEYVKTWKLYAFIRRRYEIEWRLRHLLIEKMFFERMCALCKDFMGPNAEIKEVQQGVRKHKVHQACFDKAPKCDVCSNILIGAYTKTTGANPVSLHNECVEAYKNSSRPKCDACGKKIVTEDKWATVGEKNYHTSCDPTAKK